jgi:hypothetical protein
MSMFTVFEAVVSLSTINVHEAYSYEGRSESKFTWRIIM